MQKGLWKIASKSVSGAADCAYSLSFLSLLLFHLHLYQKPVPQQTLKTHEKEKFCRRASDSNPLEPHLLLDGARLLSLSFSLLLLLHLSITLSETRGAETHKTS
jgi:hypothetical protein